MDSTKAETATTASEVSTEETKVEKTEFTIKEPRAIEDQFAELQMLIAVQQKKMS